MQEMSGQLDPQAKGDPENTWEKKWDLSPLTCCYTLWTFLFNFLEFSNMREDPSHCLSQAEYTELAVMIVLLKSWHFHIGGEQDR